MIFLSTDQPFLSEDQMARPKAIDLTLLKILGAKDIGPKITARLRELEVEKEKLQRLRDALGIRPRGRRPGSKNKVKRRSV